MFDENSELVMYVAPDGRFNLRVVCVHGDGASVIPIDHMSEKQWQMTLHYITQQKFMDYDDDFGLQFRCPVFPFTKSDGSLGFKLMIESSKKDICKLCMHTRDALGTKNCLLSYEILGCPKNPEETQIFCPSWCPDDRMKKEKLQNETNYN